MSASTTGTTWTKGLNPEQQQAVLHHAGPLLILAGAGSGKTTVLVHRTGQILSERRAEAAEICVLTFTNKAARELKHRVSARIGKSGDKLWTGTFHAFGLQVLRQNHKEFNLPKSFGVIDQSDAHSVLKECASGVRNINKANFKVDQLYAMMCDWRERGQTQSKNSADEYQVMVEVLMPKYRQRLAALGVVDFADLLVLPLELFKKNPDVLARVQNRFRYLMVDEFQDTNKAQLQLVMGLSQKHENVAVVGDDDQSIYGWRGACVENILDFPKLIKGCQVIRLERNYRSSPAILDVANHLIAKNKNRHGKVLKSQSDQGNLPKPEIFVFEDSEAENEEVIRQIRHFKDLGLPATEIAVLYRSNAQGAELEGHLRENEIRYVMTGGIGFFDRKESKDMMAYLRASLTHSEMSLRRTINMPSRGIGDTSISQIQDYSQQKNISFYLALKQWSAAGVSPKIGHAIDEYLKLLENLKATVLGQEPNAKPVQDSFTAFIHELGYRGYLVSQSATVETAEKRWQMVSIFGRILGSSLERFGRTEDGLYEFLDHMELRDLADNDEKDSKDAVQLLTLHACKGLEFRGVIIVGVEEDLLPHRTLGADVSEERRLFYVGLTRARERLILTRAKKRERNGRMQPVTPSRFLLEIPAAMVTVYNEGARPVTTEQKANLLQDFFKKMDSSIAKNRLE